MGTEDNVDGLSASDAAKKRAFDLLLAAVGLTIASGIVVFAWALASIDTRSNGFFLQKRVGKDGRVFKVIKIKTMRDVSGHNTTVTSLGDPRVTRLGRFFRRFKIDELPQLWNVFVGHMSFVGPRPDVPGYADRLTGRDRLILSIRPGITGPATLAYRNEEHILALKSDPERYNDEVIYPDKVRLNLEYIRDWSLRKDLRYIFRTIL